MRIGPINFTWLDVLLVLVPIAIVLEVVHGSPVAIFVVAGLAIIPLAGWMGRATEHLAHHYGPGIGGLLNATFGNAAELIIAIMALKRGMLDVVRASLTGSIIGNILLVLGLALLLGGLKNKRQRFNKTVAGLGSTLLALSAIGLLIPGMFVAVGGDVAGETIGTLTLWIAVILIVTYGFSLIFTLKTHQHLFAAVDDHDDFGEPWSKKKAMLLLVIATSLVALMSEFLIGSVEHTTAAWGMTEVFVGVVLVAIIGNAAEHSTAVIMAIKNKMDLAMNIAVGSGIQITLLIAPLLVFISYGFGEPMHFVFTPMEIIAVIIAVFVVKSIANDGESHWMEGVLLLAVYLILAVTFFLLPA